MSIYNRKMFNRNARNALNRTAGIPNVAMFSNGGITSPLTRARTMGTTTNLSGLPSVYTAPKFTGPFARANIGELAQRYISGKPLTASEFSVLRGAEQGFLSKQGLADSMGNFGKTRLGSGIQALLGPAAQTGGQLRGFVEGAAGTAAKTLLGSKDGSMPADKAAGPQLSQDFLKSLDISFMDPTNLQTASSRGGAVPPSAFKGLVVGTQGDTDASKIPADERMARDQQIRQAQDITAQGGLYVTDQETGAFPASADAQEDALRNLTDSLVPGRDEEEGDDLVETQATIDDDGEDDATPSKQDGTTATDGVSAKEEIDRVINSGTKEEQEKTLDGFIKEFMDKAPGYEGADSGLILAKIGFAMAAGKSPRAIENISKALSDGADMLIKDKNKKSEFDRQLKLSALQYGLSETGKLRAQERLDDRNFLKLVDKNGKPARISMTELLANDGKIPEGLLDKDVFLAQEKAALERIKNVNAQTAALRKELVLSDTAAKDIQESYGKAAKRYIDAEVGIEFTEKALLNLADDGSVTGLKGSIKDFANKLANAGGLDLGTKYQTKADFEKNVRMAFQKLIPVSLAGVQSANSISNKDVQFLADAYIDSAILEGGTFNLAMIDENVLASKLQGVVNEFRRNQATAAGDMRGIEDRLTNRILPGQGQGSAVTLLAQSKKALEPFGVGQRTSLGLVDTGQKNAQGMPIFKLPSAG